MSASTQPWLDAGKPIEERVAGLLSAMTREEKVAQMVQISYSIITPERADEWARLGVGSVLHCLGDDARRIQRLATGNRLGIPVLFGIDAIHGHGIHNGATVFPTQLALAASWNPANAERMAAVTAKEVAAEGLHWTFSPVLCLGRDPRWGRVDETFGEDPYLSGKMGAATVRGYQGESPASSDRIVACAKHYIAYGESTGGRDSYDSAVSMRMVRDVFLPPFEEAVKAGVHTVMAGYEPVDRVPCSAHRELLRDVLKGELGFKGFVVTDWMNVLSLHTRHKMAANLEEASRIALEAGNDMIMTTPEFYESTLALLARGEVAESQIDEAVTRILNIKFLAGLFDNPDKVKTLPLSEDPAAKDAEAVYNCEAHRKENLEIARECLVLLKNGTVGGSPALPIAGQKPATAEGGASAGRRVRRIAVIGPNADSVRAQFGDWTFFTHPTPHYDAVPTFRVDTMLDGLKKLAGERGVGVIYEKGCDATDPSVQWIAKARKAAKKADAVFVFVGDTLPQTGEAHDRANLELTGMQNELVEALSADCRKRGVPLVSVLVNGKPLEFGRVAEASDAVVETFNSGTHGGIAAAEAIFGAFNPSGRLPISFPRTTGQIPVYYNQIPGWHEGKYHDCDRTPLFAFGEGLSYTEFRYDSVSLSKDAARAGETVLVNVTLTNAGDREGTETVQVYAADLLASIVTPVKELKAFARVTVPAGATVTVGVPLPTDSLSLVGIDGRRVLEPGEFAILAGHDSRDQSLLSARLTVTAG